MIQDTGKDQQLSIASQLINRIISVEQLPLPIFALHFLGATEAHSPSDILDVARKLRDCPDVVALRKWLAKWEPMYNSADLDTQEKALDQIRDLKSSLQAINQDYSLFSVLRPQFSSGPGDSLKMSLDLSSLAAPWAKFHAILSRRHVFLAALKRDLVTDRELGARMSRIVGRAISPAR